LNDSGGRERPAVVVCPSEDDTVRLGASIGSALRGGDVIFADGELGAGKTCLIRGICAGLGFSGAVRSPSFAVVNEYSGRCRICHVDLYRIPESSPELEDLSRGDCFEGETVTMIEWGEKLRRWGVRPSASVRLILLPDGGRRVELTFEDRDLARRAAAAGVP
jgi:tRNA threonylcarbamoyl adenosine modification protein YjeE